MGNFQAEKMVVRSLHEAIARADAGSIADVLGQAVTPNWHWRGMHPFHEQHGAEAVANAFWTPLMTAFTRLQRRPDIFMAGLNQIDDFQSVWVVQMGHFMGLFDREYLGIQPTGRIAMMRFCEFNRVENGKIAETAMFCDIPQVMIQAGQNPFPPQTGAHLIQPGPMTHEGLMYEAQDPAVGEATLATINRMLHGMGDTRSGVEDYSTHLAKCWHEDMLWWGPCGIGATYTIPRYREQHGAPFRDGLTDYKFNGHLCRIAEGNFGGFFGWANLTLRNAGGYLGMTGGPGLADMRVVDIYRAQDGKLAENWIFIDLLHYLNMQGLDVLARNATVQTRR